PFLYANDPSYWMKKKEEDPAFLRLIASLAGSNAFKWILYGLLILLVVFVLYQVLVVNNFLVAPAARKKKRKPDETMTGEVPDDIDHKLAAAIEAREYRLAVRYMYLKTLRSLNDRGLIKMHSRATNHDYLRQMEKQ